MQQRNAAGDIIIAMIVQQKETFFQGVHADEITECKKEWIRSGGMVKNGNLHK